MSSLNKARFISLGIVFLIVVLGVSVPQVAADDTSLAEQYAPVLYFAEGETCYPVEIEYGLSESWLYRFDTTTKSAVLISETPTAAQIGALSSVSDKYYYLDNQAGTIHDDGIIKKYEAERAALGYTVYAFVSDHGDKTIIEYWMYYIFNDGSVNIHEGDWECVQVVIDASGPVNVFYSQHHSGQQVSWDLVDKDGDHARVYVSRGSHASYPRHYSGSFGVAGDKVDARGMVLEPSEYTIEVLDSQPWLGFIGHWGSYEGFDAEVKGQVGPPGPQYREDGAMWFAPLEWGASLPVASSMLFIAEWIVYYFIWIFLGITALSFIWVFLKLFRKSKKEGLGPRLLSVFYIDGANPRSIGNILCIIGVGLAVLGIFSPWYVVSADVSIPGVMDTSGMVDLFTIDGMQGIRANMLDTNSGLTPIGAFSMPFWVFLLIGIFSFFLGLIGIRESRKAGHRYLREGAGWLIPVVLILVVVMALPTIGGMLNLSAQGGTEMMEIFQALAASPMGGAQSFEIIMPDSTIADIDAVWSMGTGGYLLLIGGILIVMAGLLEIFSKSQYFAIGESSSESPRLFDGSSEKVKDSDKGADEKSSKDED